VGASSLITEETMIIDVVKCKSAFGQENSVEVFSSHKWVIWAKGRYLFRIRNTAVKDTELITIVKSLVVLESWLFVWRIEDQRNRDILASRVWALCSEIEEELLGGIILSERSFVKSNNRASIRVAGIISTPAAAST